MCILPQSRIKKNQTPRSFLLIIVDWISPSDQGAKVERHAPALPLSRDQQQLIDLRQSLAVSRMVFGQPRQEQTGL